MKRTYIKAPLITGLAAALLLSSLATQAEDVRLPIGYQSQTWDGALPRRGSTKTEVENEFGSPQSTDGPTGEPPIYFWEYPDFTVYFESDYVLHAVVKQRKPVQ